MKISVIIPVYNAEKYVEKAVNSALPLDAVHEIILVEDQSPDNALEICKNLEKKNDKIKLYQHPDKGNHGAGATRNLGIEKATGDFIAFLDADDFYLPNRFDAEKKLFENPEVDGVYGALGTHYHSEIAKEEYYPVYGDKMLTVYEKHHPDKIFEGLIGLLRSFGFFSIDTLTIRKSALEKNNLKINPTLSLHQDTDFMIRLAYYTKLYPGIIEQPVAMRGIHTENRISKIDSKKVSPAKSMGKFWGEVEKWARTESSMEKKHLQHIARLKRSYQIAGAPFIAKWGMILKFLIVDFQSIRSGLYNKNFRNNLW